MALDKQALNDETMDQVSGGTILRYRVQPGDNLNMIAQRKTDKLSAFCRQLVCFFQQKYWTFSEIAVL